jgi:hypothetical protein
MQQCMYKFYPVLPLRKKSANAKRTYPTTADSRKTPDDSYPYHHSNLSRPYSVKYEDLHVRCETADLRVDPDYNTRVHLSHLSTMSNTNEKAQSKLTDLTKEYYDRQAYNQLLGSNKKNFKKKHSFLNVYSVVTKLNYAPHKYNLFHMEDKYYVEDADEDYSLPMSSCNHTYGTVNRVCINCRQNMDRMSAKKRISAKTHPFSREKVEAELTFKSAKPYQEVILPVSFFKTSNSQYGGQAVATVASVAASSSENNNNNNKHKSVRINSEFTKSEVVNDIFDFDLDIKPDMNLWTVA